MKRIVTNYESGCSTSWAARDLTMDRVLLIDDDAGLIHEQVRQAFPSPGYDVHVADTGSGGIASVRAGAPDVILLDLRLPDRSERAAPARSSSRERSISTARGRRRRSSR